MDLASSNIRSKLADKGERSFAMASVYGVLRHYFSLSKVLRQLVKKPLKNKDNDIKSLLLAGLYQIHYMRSPAYATVSENVEAARLLKKPWACKLVNAVLRNYERGKHKEINNGDNNNLEHPLWYIRKCQSNWPSAWFSILESNNKHPPLTIRTNNRFITRGEYSKILASAGLSNRLTQISEQGITLTRPSDPKVLPFFQEGACSVQDEAAQLPVSLLELETASKVLDMCAAPGGKTTHILELCDPNTSVTAVDSNPKRLKLLEENLCRLKLSCKVVQGDARNKTSWWDGEAFDRILIDAPCSASGVVRRHPDIKIRRKPEELFDLCNLQLKILEESWTMLSKKGILVYVTCSIFQEENDLIIEKFLTNKKEACLKKIKMTGGIAANYGYQILPGLQNMDGFYFCRLQKS